MDQNPSRNYFHFQYRLECILFLNNYCSPRPLNKSNSSVVESLIYYPWIGGLNKSGNYFQYRVEGILFPSKKRLSSLEMRFRHLENVCGSCHNTERHKFDINYQSLWNLNDVYNSLGMMLCLVPLLCVPRDQHHTLYVIIVCFDWNYEMVTQTTWQVTKIFKTNTWLTFETAWFRMIWDLVIHLRAQRSVFRFDVY